MYCRFLFRSGIDRLGWLMAMLLLPAAVQAQWFSADATIMGTAIHVEIWHEVPEVAQQGIADVLEELRRIDNQMSPYKPESEVSRINTNAGGDPVPVSVELVRLIQKAERMSILTDGAFDITFASAGHLYDYRSSQRPAGAVLKAAVEAIDFRQIAIDETRSQIRLARAGMRIDLGGIAKGYAVEKGAELLRAQGVRHALISAGGDTRVIGDRAGRPWVVGVRHPRHDRNLITRIPLVDEAISTSGDYERFFEEQGIRYHHILNPVTGDSAREVISVTVVGPDATLTDALSTSVFVLGAERGLVLVDRLPGYEAMVMDRAGKLHYSAGLQPTQAATQ